MRGSLRAAVGTVKTQARDSNISAEPEAGVDARLPS